MSGVTSTRWAAVAGALAALVTGVLLAIREGSPLLLLAVVPLVVGLAGSSFRKTWGVFATLGGAALLFTAYGVGEVPGWAALVAAAGVAVVSPALVGAFRFDAVAAAAWLALSGLLGGAGALAWSELDGDETLVSPIELDKPVAPHGGFRVEVDWRGEPPCHHRRWRR